MMKLPPTLLIMTDIIWIIILFFGNNNILNLDITHTHAHARAAGWKAEWGH
jgi:hypothetical protein